MQPTSDATQTTRPATASTMASTDAPSTIAPTTVVGVEFDPAAVGEVAVEGPISGGAGRVVLGAGGLDLASVGYVEEEFFITGTASAYESTAALGSDGRWVVSPVQPKPFTTRIAVRRPADPAAFNGSVAVEWLNVTAGFDNAPDWTYVHTELIRSGWAWVGVSAQEVGIIGREGAIVPLALQLADPIRYAALSHPGDSYSYDIFSQAGAAVRTQPDLILAGLEPGDVFAFGESQSAFRLTTYVNAVAPLANVYDAYLVHSRGSAGAPLSQAPLPDVDPPDPTLVRTDLTAPVLNFLSETDVVGERLGYSRARQPDTASIRTWEVAGTAHADLYNLGLGDADDGSGAADASLFEAMSVPPSSIYGGVIECDLPINTGPHTYVLRSAVAALEKWVRTGEPPASMPPIELDADGGMTVDDLGIVRGGIRTPHVDVPIARLSGVGQTGSRFCGLFGTTVAFDATQLAALYADHDTFVSQWNEAVEASVRSGALLDVDAERLKAVAGASAIGS